MKRTAIPPAKQQRFLRHFLFGFIVLLAIAASTLARPVYAATITVNCGDSTGLISALTTANNNEGSDIIRLANNCPYQLTAVDNSADGSNGLPNITSDITLDGNGATIERTGAVPAFRILHVAGGGSLTLQNITLANGQADGAALWNSGVLNITGSTIRNNTGGSYGAIVNFGTLTMDQSTIADNSAANAGALFASGTVNITRSTLHNNAALANDGGAIYVGDGALITIANSTFSNNTANLASGFGGALVTIAGSPAVAPSVSIVNSTFSGNSAASGSAIQVFTGNVDLQNSIFTDGNSDNCSGTNSLGNNLSSDYTCTGGSDDLTLSDPLLGPLGNNGGATQTFALRAGSPAIDAGNAGACAAAPVNGIDQRGVGRPQDAGCDIGAYESWLIDFNGLSAQNGAAAKNLLNTTYSPQGVTFDFYNFTGGYPTTGGNIVTVATHPDGADALVNFAFAADFVGVKYVASGALAADLIAYAQTITPADQPTLIIDQSTEFLNPYPKTLTVTGSCIRSVQLETQGFDFSFDDLEISPMSGPDSDGDGVVDQCDTPFIVTSSDDADDGACTSGHCSLREAINAANAKPNGTAPDEIHFNIPGGGVQTIQPSAPLPYILGGAVIIDGSTQPGASCAAWPPTLRIELDGSNAGSGATSGLSSFAGNMTVRGLAIHSFANEGIGLFGGNNTIQCNFLGTNAAGTQAQGFSFDQIFVNATTNNLIGGTTPGTGNLIAGNSGRGIMLAGAANNTVQGNYIGTNATGTALVGSRNVGILITGGPNLIGGATAAARNIIAGSSTGMNIAVSNGNLVQGNYIGTNSAGTVALPNNMGVVVGTGTPSTEIRDNVISGNFHSGVHLNGGTAAALILTGNIIGADATGTAALGNGQYGVLIENASDNSIGVPGNGNLIAYNGVTGVQVQTGTGNAIRSNRIFANGSLGIDLGADGVTFNHAGAVAGPNAYQNYPVLTLATSDGATTRVQGTFEGAANTTFSLDFFTSPTCDASSFGEGESFLGSLNVTTAGNGQASFDQSFPTGVAEPQGVSAVATDTSNGNSSEFSYCRPIAATNLNWEAALTLSGASVQQYITDQYQEKWFKFPVQPGDKVRIKLTGLAGSVLSLHRDPHVFYNRLLNPPSAAVLSAEAADTGFLPYQSLPYQSLPYQSLPYQSLPYQSLPTGFLPYQSLPYQSLPYQSLPAGSLPYQSLPYQSLPTGLLPYQSLPVQSLPYQSLPSASIPANLLPEAYSGAARRSMMSIALDPSATVQTIELNTYDLLEDLYVRVTGPNDLANPFALEVTVDGGICSVVQTIPANLLAIAGPPPAAGTHQSLLLTDSGRLTGTPAEIATALAKLQTLANRPDVAGLVIDLADARYQRVAAANQQADQNLACPTAKNLVAAEIKQIIDLYRAANTTGNGQTTLQYIVLAGSAHVIPFFQVQDVAGLASEKEYIVPVQAATASEAGLKVGLVQGQDGYGARVELALSGRSYAMPDLAVGRLVETANDISAIVDGYIATNGVVTPNSALITGYDFVGDAALAIQAEAEAGTNANADTLIQLPGLPPSDASAWSAAALRTKLFAGGHDLVVLSGHFSAGSLLAADYRTSIAASEVTASPVDFTNVLVFTLGCHGGYTIPGVDLLSGASPDPDWPKAFLRKGVAGYIAATGYAYGDTELTEYGERLFVGLTQQLRTGSGPIAIGQALVAAKQRYLAQSAQLTGIDEKTLVEMTLYGLPMMKVNMPGQRLNPPVENSIVTAAPVVNNGPGADLGLRVGQPAVLPNLTTNTKSLVNLADNSTIDTTYLSSPDGVVVNPFEPLLPKELYNINVAGAVLRGVALRSATYTDQLGIVPLTGSPATETSQAHPAFKTNTFYPNQVWTTNYLDAISGGPTRLVTVPAQFKSTTPDAIDGTLRSFTGLNFNLYYLPSSWTNPNSSPTLKAAAVAAAPTILSADAVVNGNSMTFTVHLQGEEAAGIQAVWVLYTGQSGPLYGEWQPLDLAQTNPTLDPTLWQGTLTLPNGANSSELQFMVQAVSGAGLASLSTNQGDYYAVAPATPPAPAQPTELTFLSAPTAGIYLQESSFTVRLTSAGDALANQLVTLLVGGQSVQATTAANGRATLILQPNLLPGDYTVQASFRSNASYLGSSATNPFTLAKASTALGLTPQPGTVTALLTDASNRPLGLRSIFFVVTGNNQSFVRSVIGDFWGNAPLGVVPLPPGSYTVDVYFSGQILLGNNQTITLVDDYYEPSQARTSLTIAAVDMTAPVVTVAFPALPVGQNGWFNAQDAANGIVGSVTANDSTTGGSNITAINCTGATVGAINGLGTTQASAVLTVVAEGSNAVSCTATDSANNSGAAAGSTNTAIVKIDRIGPETTLTGQPSNPSNVTNATFTFAGTDGGAGVASFACQLDSGNFVACTSPQSYTGLSNGSHTFVVQASDGAGNPDVPPASYTWLITPGTLVGSCGSYTVYRTPQGQYTAPGWSGTIKVGTSGNNTLNGTTGPDLMLGLAGNDTLQGQAGNDLLCAGDGNDVVQGFAGNDVLEGGIGNDVLNGGVGDFDDLLGGDGNDTLLDGDGVSNAQGGAGNDVITIALRNGWRNTSNQTRFEGLTAGYGNDIVVFAILDPARFFVNLSGDERDVPPSPQEGNTDRLALTGKITTNSVIIKFESQVATAASADSLNIPDEDGAQYLSTAEEQPANQYIFLPLISQ